MEGIMTRTIEPRRTKKTESLGLLFFLLALLLVLCLVSYDAWDPSWNVESQRDRSHNYIGPYGAYAADLLLQSLGFSAFFLALPLFYLGYISWKGQLHWRMIPKLLGFLLLLISVAAISEILQLRFLLESNFSVGGLVGLYSSRFLQENFNYQGGLILALAFLGFALIITANLSISGLFRWLLGLPVSLYRSTLGKLFQPRAEKKAAPKPAGNSPSKPSAQAGAAAAGPAVAARTAAARSGKPTQAPIPVPINAFTLKRDSSSSAGAAASAAGGKVPPAAHPAPAIEEQPLIAETAYTEGVTKPAAAGLKTSKPKLSLHHFALPSSEYLEKSPEKSDVNEAELMEMARRLQEKCAEFGAMGRVTQIHPGPIVTTFEFQPDTGVKYARVVNLGEDLCLGLQAISIRIDRIPGKSTVGIEVPNAERDTIFFREIIESEEFQKSKSKLTLVLGRTIHGEPYVTDLARMPHLLVAGATGSGKSVGINAMITSILYKASPEDVKFILVDPKRLELGMYSDIPHLLTPIVTEPKRAANVLCWAVTEMENRYKRMARFGVRNIDQFNQLMRSSQKEASAGGEEIDSPLPYIVIVIDELADLMMTSGREVEDSITRLAQMARAVGIHLILATQRPSVDVITGLIKANFPCRLAFRVSQKIDSRTIIDANGAEKLLGNGDMLFLPPGTSRLWRIHGAYISEKETQRITDFLREQARPYYNEAIEEHCQKNAAAGEEAASGAVEEEDPLYEDAMRLVVEQQQAATSLLQRRLKIGYGRAARLLDIMERDGIVGPANGSKGREVLKPANYLKEVDDRLT